MAEFAGALGGWEELFSTPLTAKVPSLGVNYMEASKPEVAVGLPHHGRDLCFVQRLDEHGPALAEMGYLSPADLVPLADEDNEDELAAVVRELGLKAPEEKLWCCRSSLPQIHEAHRHQLTTGPHYLSR